MLQRSCKNFASSPGLSSNHRNRALHMLGVTPACLDILTSHARIDNNVGHGDIRGGLRTVHIFKKTETTRETRRHSVGLVLPLLVIPTP